MGLIGGMSWEPSPEYYRLVNLLVRERLGDFVHRVSAQNDEVRSSVLQMPCCRYHLPG